MTDLDIPGPLLTLRQWELIQALVQSLKPRQALWISGYFAGLSFEKADRGLVAEIAPDIRTESTLAPAREARAITRTLTILYGSETGNSAGLARDLDEQVRALGFTPVVADMAEYNPRRLKDKQRPANCDEHPR